MTEEIYGWTDNPMKSGVADCNTDVVNDCLMHLKYENTSDAIQNMYETGQVEKQTRGYNQLLSMKHSTFDLSKFTVVGSPTITSDGVASGFKQSDSIVLPIALKDLYGKSWEYKTRWHDIGNHQRSYASTLLLLTTTYPGLGSISYNAFKHGNYSGTLQFNGKFGAGSDVTGEIVAIEFPIPAHNSKYMDVSLSFENSTGTYTLKYDVGNGWELAGTYTPPTAVKYLTSMTSTSDTKLSINCRTYASNVLQNAVDLPYNSINIDGIEVFSGNKTGLDIIKPDNYEVVGSPVISDDGVASGFRADNYILSGNAYDIDLPFDKNITIKGDNIFYKSIQDSIGLFQLQYENGGRININQNWGEYRIYITDGTNTLTLATDPVSNSNKRNAFTFEIDNDTATIKVVEYRANGTIYTKTKSVDISGIDKTKFGKARILIGTATWSGTNIKSLDLNAFKTYVDGDLVYQPCLKMPYTQSKTGSKIVDEVYRDRVIDLYEQEGQAGYYTIDEENKNFTLPMGEIYGMIESKGSSSYQPPLLSTMWSDHLLNDMSWLRADTFSWQDGNTYWLAYHELLAEYNDSASSEETEGSITFKRTPKGYKIALATQETAILNKYNSDGIAWYYILDTANKKFKLPRAKHPSLVTLTNSVPVYGNGMTLGITNGTTNYGLAPSSNTENNWAYRDSAYGTTLPRNHGRSGNTPGDGQALGITTDPTKSGIVADLSNNVKDYNMYLYFYVGAFTKSAEAQTAGLNSELLNGKADVDTPSIQAPYLKDTYVNGTSGYRIWSDGYCEQWNYGLATATTGKQTFLKEFRSVPMVILTGNTTRNASAYDAELFPNTITTKNFTHTNTFVQGISWGWVARGYIAEGWNNEGIS